MKKYFLMAIDKGNSDAMYDLGYYYQQVEEKYDLMKKYYLQAIDKGNSNSMHNLGEYYQYVEKKYDLMKKYYLQAIDKKNYNAMHNLGYYYQHIKKNYGLMKKYYFMAIYEGRADTMGILENHCILLSKLLRDKDILSNKDLQNYFCALIKKNNIISSSHIFNDKYIKEYRIIDTLCFGIDNNNLSVKNFKFCFVKILDYINHCELCKLCKPCKLKKIKHFVKYINKLRYSKNKPEYKKYTNETFKNKASQIFMEYLDLYYYEYLKKIFAPGGKGYTKTKEHFELIAKQQKK
jgi:TPR repeat protein